MYTKLEVELEKYMQIELMEESMMTPKGALLMASCKRTEIGIDVTVVFIFKKRIAKAVRYKL
jgi:hypothetical protein